MDEFYNERFAKQVERAVARMDDDEAEMFVRFAAYEIHKADIDANQRLISKRVEQIHGEIQRDVAKALARTISKGMTLPVDDVVTLVDEISKGKKKQARKQAAVAERKRQKAAEAHRQWVEAEVKRDALGRFTFEHGPAYGPGRGAIAVRHGATRDETFNLSGALGSAEHRGNAFEQKWNAPPSNLTAYTNQRTYDRIAAGAELLQGSGNPKLEAAAQMGRFAGRFGPEAEKVVGPHLRKTAYRYRGTERRPDPALLNGAMQAQRNMAEVDRSGHPLPLTDADRVAASQRAATGYLMSKLPSKKLAALQQASGKIPPSQGVIINEEGTIVTQAVGHADDHYLPFNLKNLKGLQGGHYVRSRSQGGLTTEDIYTGLVSGARSVTVVSRSGVFTIEFEDDFRGGRRYNDKARAMIGQYAHTLDAVQSEQVAQRKLSPEERAEIRDEVEREHKGMEDIVSRADLEDIVKEREREYLARPTPTKAELAEIDAIARKDNEDERSYKMARSEMISRLMEQKQARNYRLDGEGYKAALEALGEQFPYYIARVDAKTRQSTTKDNPFTAEKDEGYVMPKYNRPAGAMAGYFAEEINGKGKVPANQTDFQNWAHNKLNSQTRGVKEEGTGEGEGKPAEDKPKDARHEQRALREAAQEGKRKKKVDQNLIKIAEVYANGVSELPEGSEIVTEAASDESSARAILRDPKKRAELEKQLKKLHGMASTGDKDAKRLYNQAEPFFKEIKASAPGQQWTGSQHAESPDAPFRFDPDKYGEAFAPGVDSSAIGRQYQSEAVRAGLSGPKLAPGSLSDAELRDRAALYGYMANTIAASDFNPTEFMTEVVEMGMDEDQAKHIVNARKLAQKQAGGKGLDAQRTLYLKRSEAFHKMRYLNSALGGGSSRKPQTMGFASTGTDGGGNTPLPPRGKTKGHLTAVDDKQPTARAGSEVAELSDDYQQTSDIAFGLAELSKRLQKADDDDWYVIDHIKDRVAKYHKIPPANRGRADRDLLLEGIQEDLEGIEDDGFRSALDRYFGSREFFRPGDKDYR